MTEKKNLAASVHQRLKNIAAASGEDFNYLLRRFANERWLYRLSASPHRDRFLLKGASLFTLWFNQPHRPTRDLDLLGFGAPEIIRLETVFREICHIAASDGLTFDPASVKGAEIKEGQEYQGVRILFAAFLGAVRINLQVDVGFGDAVTPVAETVRFPTVLEFPAPELFAYPKETVIAEKFEAMVKLGISNSRMKDFWDLQTMIGKFEFDGAVLQTAIAATFERRRTVLPTRLPLALTDEFADDKGKQTQWNAFVRKNKLDNAPSLAATINSLQAFFRALIESAVQQKTFAARWRGGSWHFEQ